MSEALLGLPLEQAFRELAMLGVPKVRVSRSLAPRRESRDDEDQDCGDWRVVRVHQGEIVTLEVCRFEWIVE